MLKETPLHVALRLHNVEAVKLLLESSSLDVVCCDTFQRVKVRNLCLFVSPLMLQFYQAIITDETLLRSRVARFSLEMDRLRKIVGICRLQKLRNGKTIGRYFTKLTH